MGDLSDLRALSAKKRREKSPNILGFTFRELCELDTVKVELLPEKKGLILKHVEYEITSQVNTTHIHVQSIYTRLHSAGGKVSDCRFRGRKFDPSPVPYICTFVEIDHRIISTVILLLYADSRKYVCKVLVNGLVKLAQEKSVIR